MSFQVIAGSGHCGTMWLARVLDSVPGQRWHHELRTEAVGLPWQQADILSPRRLLFTPYWSQLEKEMGQYEVVGDSNSWPPESLPTVDAIMPIDRVIYLTRDKDDQFYSIMNHSPVWRGPEWSAAAHRRLDLYAEISGRPRDVRLLVEANDFMPDWLRDYGLTVDVYSLEELTTDIDRLRELAPLSDAALVAWQKRDINRKVAA